VQADLFKLPFRPGTFDVVYSIGVLHHTPDAKGAFERIQPMVKPGGFFSIFMHGQGNRVLYATNRWLRAWTAKASYTTTWRFCLMLFLLLAPDAMNGARAQLSGAEIRIGEELIADLEHADEIGNLFGELHRR